MVFPLFVIYLLWTCQFNSNNNNNINNNINNNNNNTCNNTSKTKMSNNNITKFTHGQNKHFTQLIHKFVELVFEVHCSALSRGDLCRNLEVWVCVSVSSCFSHTDQCNRSAVHKLEAQLEAQS